MGFFSWLFGRNKVQVQQEQVQVQVRQTASGTNISYDPNLIKNLLSDHAELFSVFGKIVAGSQSGDYTSVADNMDKFKRALQKHLIQENVKLYVYLEHALENNSGTVDIVRGFHREMDGIGRVVMGFFDRYKDIERQESLRAAFKEDLDKIAAALTDRVGREESTLYPLYMPNY